MERWHSWLRAEATNREDIDVEDSSIPDDNECNENDIDGMNDEMLVEQHGAEQRANAVQPVERGVHQEPVSVTDNHNPDMMHRTLHTTNRYATIEYVLVLIVWRY